MLVGAGSFSVLPFVAVIVGLAIPISNDFKKAIQLTELETELPERVAEYTQPDRFAMWPTAFGKLIGITLAAVLLVKW